MGSVKNLRVFSSKSTGIKWPVYRDYDSTNSEDGKLVQPKTIYKRRTVADFNTRLDYDIIKGSCEADGNPIAEEWERVEALLEQGEEEREAEQLEMEEINAWKDDFSTSVVMTDVVTKAVSKGRKQTMRAMVVVGNGKGAAGFGVGRSENRGDAMEKAQQDAFKNLVATELYGGRALYHDLAGKSQRNTKIILRSVPLGGGYRGSDLMMILCQALGLKDVAVKVIGRRNKLNVCHAFFNAISKHRSAEQTALARGLRLHDLNDRIKERLGNLHPKY